MSLNGFVRFHPRDVVGCTVRDHITARQIIAGGQTPRTEREWRSGKPQMVTQYLQGGNLKLKRALPLVEERMMIPAALETMGQFSYSVLFCRSFSCWERSPFCPWTMLLMYMLKRLFCSIQPGLPGLRDKTSPMASQKISHISKQNM